MEIAAELRIAKEAFIIINLAHQNIVQLKSIAVGKSALVNAPYFHLNIYDAPSNLASYHDFTSSPSIFSQMIAAVEHVHRMGFVHADIKPENFLYFGDGTVKLSGFKWAARLTNQSVFRFMHPAFLAPETVIYGYFSKESDIWALGMSIFFIECRVSYSTANTAPYLDNHAYKITSGSKRNFYERIKGYVHNVETLDIINPMLQWKREDRRLRRGQFPTIEYHSRPFYFAQPYEYFQPTKELDFLDWVFALAKASIKANLETVSEASLLFHKCCASFNHCTNKLLLATCCIIFSKAMSENILNYQFDTSSFTYEEIESTIFEITEFLLKEFSSLTLNPLWVPGLGSAPC